MMIFTLFPAIAFAKDTFTITYLTNLDAKVGNYVLTQSEYVTVNITACPYNTDGQPWLYDRKDHWQICIMCKEIVNVKAHDLYKAVDVPATELEESVSHYKCSDCGYETGYHHIPATSDGTGWFQDDNEYYQDWEMLTGWAITEGVWYYLEPDSGAMAEGWKWLSGKWYYLYENGAMVYNATIDGYSLGAGGAFCR